MRLRLVAVLSAGAVCLGARPVDALSLSPVSSTSGLAFSSEVAILDVRTGLPSGGILLDGMVDPAGDTIVFQVSQTFIAPPEFEPILFRIILDAVLRNSDFAGLSGVGWVPGAEPDSLHDASPDADATQNEFPIWTGDVTFTPLVPETADVFFVTFDSTLPALSVGDEIRFSIRLAGDHTFVVVPEPSTAILVGLGLAFAARRKRPS